MSPESVNYMAIAESLLDRARRAFMAEIYEDAARGAYLSALNAARAIVFEKEGIAVKTHSGVRKILYSMIREGLPFEKQLADFLAQSFDIKQSIDYGPEIVFVTREEAGEYLDRAAAFIAAAKAVCK